MLNRVFGQGNVRVLRWLGPVLAVAFALALFSGVVWGATPTSTGASQSAAVAAPPQAAPQATPGSDFEDVFPSNPFFNYLHNLYLAGVVSGYGCGGTNPPEPCVPPANLPYYRPNNTVSRLQMTKFIDIGRRNIADAIGNSLYISTTAYTALYAGTRSGGYGVQAECLNAATNCYAVEGVARAGDYAAYLYGGKGVYAESDDNGYPAIFGHAYGTNAGAYGGEFASDSWNALRVDAPPANNGRAQAFISGINGTLFALDIDPGALYVNGNLDVTGSKTGYVVDQMQNVDSTALEPGDVVVIVGSAAAVQGQIPIVTVKKATTAYDTALAGVVDQALYVPDAATRAAYAAQQQAISTAEIQRNKAIAAANAAGAKPIDILMPDAKITDEQGLPHATNAPSIPSGSYANVVTLGAYKMVKVDASFGAIHAGDLLTTSSHTGYAMKVTDKLAAMGAVIGKALSDLPSGSGTIPVMVTLK